MADAINRPAPVHLWIVGLLSLLWNGFGCFDYVMTRSRDTDYLAAMMPGTDPNAVLAYIDGFPLWVQAGWALGVWAGLAGAVLLLLRSRYAVWGFALSLLGAITGIGYQIANPGGPAEFHEGANAVMPYVIILVAAAQLWYGWSMAKKGVLR